MKRETTAVITLVLALTLAGCLMVFSARGYDESAGELRTQVYALTIGFVVMLVAARFDYHRLKDGLIFRGVVLGTLALLVLVLLVGDTVNGAQRWIRVAGFQLQPSELGKFALILLLAVKLTDNRENLRKFFSGFLPPAFIAVLFAGLVLAERDLGVPVLMMGVAFIMMAVAGVSYQYLVASCVPLAAGVVALIVTSPHRVERLLAFRDPWHDPLDSGFNLIQSYSAFAQGGLWGKGAGASEQKLGYLFASHTDFVYSLIGEEFGLVGTLTVLGLFAGLLYAGYRIIINAQDMFGALLATGIVSLISLQAGIIMGVTTGLLPTKGLPLPFISYGGTALIVFLGLAGILSNIGMQGSEQISHGKRTHTH
ncbi:MAG: cell division protein FtsW [Candidatus Hydrogenedentes bacterium]|nr:cell division protein FtsW [Candidatus Hydrogenedentota bacterium]